MTHVFCHSWVVLRNDVQLSTLFCFTEIFSYTSGTACGWRLESEIIVHRVLQLEINDVALLIRLLKNLFRSLRPGSSFNRRKEAQLEYFDYVPV
jgi:hypothetical protein